MSHGSFSNVITKYKKSLQPVYGKNEGLLRSDEGSSKLILKDSGPGQGQQSKEERPSLNEAETDISIENLKITNVQDFGKNGFDHVSEAGQKAPLSWFLNSSDYQQQEGRSLQSIYVNKQSYNTNSPPSGHDRGINSGIPIKNIDGSRVSVSNGDMAIVEELRGYGGKAWQYYGGGTDQNIKSEEKDRRRHELFLIDQRRKRLEQFNHDLTIKESNLKVREAKVAELAPSVRQLQQMGVTFDTMMSYILLVNERSVLGRVDARKAALSLSHDFKEFRSLGNILKAKQKAEQTLSELDMLITQRQAALNGITERLAQLTGSNYNDNNDGLAASPSMKEYIMLSLLKGSNTNMLNRMGIN